MAATTGGRSRWRGVVLAALTLALDHLPAADAAPGNATSEGPEAGLVKLTFDTPGSVTRRGFTKVTVGDVISPAKGYGFHSTQGPSAYDHGGSDIVRPTDEHTARTYGACRTTSDLTCAFIEGTTDTAFLVALPDGVHTVWFVASDAEEDPPLFEVRANGQKKLDVRIPRARFVFLEPFQARATEGRLQIEFKGRHGWLLNGLVIGKASSAVDDTITKLERDNVKVGIVRCWPQRAVDRGGRGEYQIVPERIEAPTGRLAHVASGEVKQWWLTVRMPEDTPAGRYRMALTLRPEKAPPTVLEWRLLVLPFQLIRSADKHWGTWLESFPPVGGLRGPEQRGRNTPGEQARLVRADLVDYRDHGCDLAIFNYYFGVKENPDGSFTYDISKLAQGLDDWKTLGTDTPVAVGCEYTFRNLEYGLAEPGVKHVPGTFSPKAREAIVGLVRHIRDEAQRRGWPQLYFYPIDEPGNNKTENRMRFAENVLDFVHQVPVCKTATTVGASAIQRLGDRVDVRIYAYGSYSRKKVLEETRQGHPFWYYENGMFYGHSTLATRGLTGFEFLRSGAEVATTWGFDCTTANPENDFDGGHKDWNVMFPGVDAPTPTIYWELCRESVDDCRYVATLQQQIRQAKEGGRSAAAQHAERVLAPLLEPDGATIDNTAAFARYRWRIAREILALRGDHELALRFVAVVNNPAPPDRTGPNLVQNPSFEDPAQADGSPPGQYHLGYPESKEKLLGALRVSDEAVPWAVQATLDEGPIRVALYRGDRKIAEQAGRVEKGQWQGAFQTRGLRPGVYLLQVTLDVSSPSPPTARRQLILAPDPFDWPVRRP